jgi:hypothetical protein
MTAMCAENRIVIRQMGAYSGSDRFLTDVGVTCSMDQSSLVRTCQFFLGLTNDLHRAIEL